MTADIYFSIGKYHSNAWISVLRIMRSKGDILANGLNRGRYFRVHENNEQGGKKTSLS